MEWNHHHGKAFVQQSLHSAQAPVGYQHTRLQVLHIKQCMCMSVQWKGGTQSAHWDIALL
jgi:hypothetical protein